MVNNKNVSDILARSCVLDSEKKFFDKLEAVDLERTVQNLAFQVKLSSSSEPFFCSCCNLNFLQMIAASALLRQNNEALHSSTQACARELEKVKKEKEVASGRFSEREKNWRRKLEVLNIISRISLRQLIPFRKIKNFFSCKASQLEKENERIPLLEQEIDVLQVRLAEADAAAREWEKKESEAWDQMGENCNQLQNVITSELQKRFPNIDFSFIGKFLPGEVSDGDDF